MVRNVLLYTIFALSASLLQVENSIAQVESPGDLIYKTDSQEECQRLCTGVHSSICNMAYYYVRGNVSGVCSFTNDRNPDTKRKGTYQIYSRWLGKWLNNNDISTHWGKNHLPSTTRPSANSLANFNGTWTCPKRGKITFTQNSNGDIQGNFSGQVGDHWHSTLTGGGTLLGEVNGDSFDIIMQNGDGTHSTATATIAADGKTFIGDWVWKDGTTVKDAGVWDCYK